ncbi:MAG TPA: dihydrofolate reductase family protein [Candidatus Sulfotelmatobacter sp.]|nr:dihydrofolate reductase family protein [Candidatus Sulfotelmatobacter sp.]
MSVSLDGFVATPDGSLDWVLVDEELHAAFNEEARGLSAFLYGRHMYELMTAYWPTAEADPTVTPVEIDFARLWGPMPKVVFSRTLTEVGWNSRLVRDDAVDEVARLKARPGYDMGVGGPDLASTFMRAGLIDEYRLYVNPVVLGAGKRFFPDGVEPLQLRLTETRTFGSGVVYLRYQTGAPDSYPR